MMQREVGTAVRSTAFALEAFDMKPKAQQPMTELDAEAD